MSEHDEMTSTTGENRQFWFNSRTKKVEQGLVSPAAYRIGPFDTAEEASRAYETLAERSREWDEEEAREDSWED